jgi:hypothetical protein
LILSFCYELPLLGLTAFYRVNPRLFDVVSVLGLLVLPGLRRTSLPPVFRRWAYLVAWYVVCALVWTVLWLPWEGVAWYTVFFAGRYVQGLFAIYLAASMPLDARQKRILHYLAVAGGVFVALYAIPEYLAGGSLRPLTDQKELLFREGSLFSSLGTTYFHVAAFSTVSCAIAMSLAACTKQPLFRWLAFAVALFCAWPAVFCGSRAGLLGAALVVVFSFLFIRELRTKAIALALVVFLAFSLGLIRQSTIERLQESSLSLTRLSELEESESPYSIAGRSWILRRQGFDILAPVTQYEWQGWRWPVFGAGFYVAPVIRDGELFYRIGYGIHNVYAFSLEQGGVPGLVLFLLFLVACLRELWRMSKRPASEDRAFALGMWVFLLALLPIAWGGEVFWQGSGTENLNTYLVLLFTLATKPTA